MSRHAQITENTGVKVYFADPHSPWQRGINENTNGLLRQYIPKKRPLFTVTQEEIKMIQQQLNNRLQKGLVFKTPNEVFM